MKYAELPDGTIQIQMKQGDYDLLLMMAGFAAGSASAQGNMALFWSFIEFTNRMNQANPRFTQYEIPPEFAKQ
jgi:hypothetical protein